MLISVVVLGLASLGVLSLPFETAHAWRLPSAAPIVESMSVVHGQQNPNCPQFQVFGFPVPKTEGVLERLTGLDFNPVLPRVEADRLEANGQAWVLPKFRDEFRE